MTTIVVPTWAIYGTALIWWSLWIAGRVVDWRLRYWTARADASLAAVRATEIERLRAALALSKEASDG